MTLAMSEEAMHIESFSDRAAVDAAGDVIADKVGDEKFPHQRKAQGLKLSPFFIELHREEK